MVQFGCVPHTPLNTVPLLRSEFVPSAVHWQGPQVPSLPMTSLASPPTNWKHLKGTYPGHLYKPRGSGHCSAPPPNSWAALEIKLIFLYSEHSHVISQDMHGNSVINTAQIVCAKFLKRPGCVLPKLQTTLFWTPLSCPHDPPQIHLGKPHALELHLLSVPQQNLTPQLPWACS